jgi:hypothetical protein
MRPTEKQLLDLSQSWRTGADELRNEARGRHPDSKVTKDVELAAMAIESCAARLEAIAHAPEKTNDQAAKTIIA